MKDFPRGARDAIAMLQESADHPPAFGVWGYRAHVDAEGVARFWHARPDARYTLWLGSVGDRYAAKDDVGPGTHEVSLIRGGKVRGRLRPGTEATHVVLWGRAFGELRRPVGTDGRFEISGLPPGRFQLMAEIGQGIHGPFHGSPVDVEPGDDVVLGP